MAIYEYNGCVTGVCESDTVQLMQPTEPLMPVVRDANSYTERLLSVGLLLGDDRGSILCTPTSIEFVPKVTLLAGKDKIILRAVLEINGEAILNLDGNKGFADIYCSTSDIEFAGENTPEYIANYLFLYSGVDLMRQMDVGNYFNYEPYNNLKSNQPIYISGLTDTADLTNDFMKIPASVKLTFKVIDNLPSDAVDFTLEQWGHDMSVYGCAVLDLSNAPQ